MTYEEARAQFPVFERWAYMNAGTMGPLSRATLTAMDEQIRHDQELGRGGSDWFTSVIALREQVRTQLAALLGTAPERVALTFSTTDGCNIVLSGLDLTADDEVITTDQEHFGLTGPVYASGARVVITAADEDAILGAITPRTKLIATCEVLWTTGRRLDLHRVKAESGLPVLVDGAQSAGAIAVEVGELDFYTVSAQKWLCAPEPTGALYVRDPESVRIVAPSYSSQSSYELSGAFVPKEGAARFDSGRTGMPTLVGLVAALDTHPAWRYERAVEMAASCAELLGEHVEIVTVPGHSTLVSFRPPGDPAELVQELAARSVIVRELPGRNLVRVSCGWWTSSDDLERVVDALRR